MRYPAPPYTGVRSCMAGMTYRFPQLYHAGEEIFYVYPKVDIVQLATFKNPEHEGYVLCGEMASSVQPVAAADGNVPEAPLYGNVVYVETSVFKES